MRMGKLLRQGWTLQRDGCGMFLTHGGRASKAGKEQLGDGRKGLCRDGWSRGRRERR